VKEKAGEEEEEEESERFWSVGGTWRIGEQR